MTNARPILFAVLGAAAVVALCAGEARAQGPNIRTMLPGFDQPILLDTMAIRRPITGDRAAIVAAINTVLTEWKIPIEERDPATGRSEHVRAQVSRRIGGEAASTYFDCGQSFSGRNADIYRLRLAVAAWVEPAAGAPKELRVAAMASGRDPAGSRSSYGKCASTGALEERLWNRVRELVTPTPGE